MSACSAIRKPKRRVCVGDMVDVITLMTRSLDAPTFNNPDFDNVFAPLNASAPKSLAMIVTPKGKTYFDSVSETDVDVTHYVYITYNPDVTSEIWVYFEGRRFDVLRVEDLEERHEFMLLTCVDRGLVTKNASKA